MLKVGDKVKVKKLKKKFGSYFVENELSRGFIVEDDKRKFFGKTVTISKVKTNKLGELEYKILEDKGKYWWSDAEFEYENKTLKLLGKIRDLIIKEIEKEGYKICSEVFDDDKGYSISFSSSDNVISVNIKVGK